MRNTCSSISPAGSAATSIDSAAGHGAPWCRPVRRGRAELADEVGQPVHPDAGDRRSRPAPGTPGSRAPRAPARARALRRRPPRPTGSARAARRRPRRSPRRPARAARPPRRRRRRASTRCGGCRRRRSRSRCRRARRRPRGRTSSSPSGSSSGTSPAADTPRSCSSTRWKSACCLSSLVMKTSRGMPASAACCQAISVPTSTPSTALTTTTARSATDSATSMPPAKSAYPGASIEVDRVGPAVATPSTRTGRSPASARSRA